MRDTTNVQITRERDLYLPKGASLGVSLRGTSEFGEAIYVVKVITNGSSESEADALMGCVAERVGRLLS